jgi:hypothetical protein
VSPRAWRPGKGGGFGQPEGVYARTLLVTALEEAAGDEFRRKLEASRTPERRERDRKIAVAIERWRG